MIFFSIPPASERVSHWLLPASGLYHHCGLCFLASIIFESIKVLVAQSCLTLCDLMDHSPPCSSVHRILQATILEWVVISFSRGSTQPRDQTCVSYISCIITDPPENTYIHIKMHIFWCLLTYCFFPLKTRIGKPFC